MKNTALRFAQSIVDYHIESHSDYADEWCRYCLAMVEGNDVFNLDNKIIHSSDCIVLEAKKFIKEHAEIE